ncbi:ParB/Srx family N-terminal domain-containing protein [Sphingomonas sp. ID0503]|uniref:ParB/Srx family N-terminal domain-containing protein n=1 Tax=Sphingomonas sp. ID0503 TaxID=3399691 RepID=UPI003AFB6595
MPVASLRPGPNATRKRSRQQIRRIAESIAEFGFVFPITVYDDGVVASGFGRLDAAKLLNLEEVPAVRLDHLTKEQARLLALADNKLAEGRSWDLDALRQEFFEIGRGAPEINLGSSGFTIGERDVLIGRHRVDELADLDEAPEPVRAPVSVVGDHW